MTIKIKGKWYSWMGLNEVGKKIKGHHFSTSSHEILLELKQNAVTPIQIKRNYWFHLISIPKKEQLLMYQQLHSFHSAGLSLTQSLDIFLKTPIKPITKAITLSIKRDIYNGQSLFCALAKYPQHFNKLSLGLIKAGEQSGTLASLLQQLTYHVEFSDQFKRKATKALYYPAIVLSCSLLVGALFLYFLIPHFQMLFSTFHAELPVFTRLVINFSAFIHHYGFFTILYFALCVGGLCYFKKTRPSFSFWLDKQLLNLPLLGSLAQKYFLARMTRTMAILLTAGITLFDCLEMTAQIVTNHYYCRFLLQARSKLALGWQLQTIMQEFKLLPHMVKQMITIGEETGSLESMLFKIATIYEEEVEMAVTALSTLIEPLLILILAIFIGVFILAMYLPIFSLSAIF